MGMLLNRLLIILIEEDLHSTNYFIAKTMLENFEKIIKMPIADVAKLCGVSKSTISKFARKIGFADFQELRESIPNKQFSEYSYNINVMKYIENNGFNNYSDMVISDIKLLNNIIKNSNASKLAEDLIKYQKVAAFGLLYSETAAIDFQTKLAYNNKFIFTSMSDVKQQEYIANADDDTLIIIFSHSGNFLIKHQMREGEIHKSAFDKTKAKVVVITSNSKLELGSRANYCIVYPNISNISTHSHMYAMITDYITMEYRKLLKNQD